MTGVFYGTFTMGPLLRKHFNLWESGGDRAVEKWMATLSEKQKQQLAMEMAFYVADEETQEVIAAIRDRVEKSQTFLGFTKD